MIISYQHNCLHDRQIENHWIIDRLITDCGQTIYQEKRLLNVNEITNQHSKIVTRSIKCQSVKSYMFVYVHEICEPCFIRLSLVDIYCILRTASCPLPSFHRSWGLYVIALRSWSVLGDYVFRLIFLCLFFFFMRFFIFSHGIWIAA